LALESKFIVLLFGMTNTAHIQ